MRKKALIIISILALFVGQSSFGQDQIIDNLNKIPNFINPSFYGFKNATKIGVMNKFPGKTFTNSLEHRYAFASTYFEESSFSLGLDFYNTKLKNSGYSNTQASLSYVYELQLYNGWILYSGITAGFSSTKYDFSELVFQDQIDLFTTRINAVSIDPLAENGKISYVDIGASVMIHNDENMFLGLSFKHLNTPKNTIEEDANYKLEMLVSAQMGYELELNKYGQNMLPRHSYLYLFGALSKQGNRHRLDFYQEFNLSTFGIGLSQHFNYLEDVNVHEIGVNSTIHMEFFDFGISYKVPFGANSAYFVNNALSAFLIFDLDPFRSRRRGDFSIFY